MKTNKTLVLVVGLLALVIAGQTFFISRLALKVQRFERQALLSSQPEKPKRALPDLAKSSNDEDSYSLDGFNWDPLAEMERIKQEMNRMFKNSMGRGFWLTKIDPLDMATYDLNVDLKSEKDRYIIKMDMPGMDKDKINIEIQGRFLRVTGARSMEEKEEGGGFVRKERSFGKFLRSIELPEDADPARIEASYDKGVLAIIIGKSVLLEEKPGSKKIPVS